MNTVEYIVLIIIALLALLFIIRTIIKIAKGEDPCMFCKTCGDDKEKSSCCSSKEEAPFDNDKTQEYDIDEEEKDN